MHLDLTGMPPDGQTDWGSWMRSTLSSIKVILDALEAGGAGGALTDDSVQLNHLVASVRTSLAKADASLSASQVDAAADARISSWVGAAPEAMNTLIELAQRIESESGEADAILAAVNQRVRFVEHGAVAGTARPTGTAPVIWVGSVQPANLIEATDIWLGPEGVGGTITQASYDLLVARVAQLETEAAARPDLWTIPASTDPDPAGAVEGDFVFYETAVGGEPVPEPQIDVFKQFRLAGLAAGAPVTAAGGTDDDPLTVAPTSGIVVALNSIDPTIREAELDNSATARTMRWDGQSIPAFAVSIGFRIGVNTPTAATTIAMLTGVCQFSLATDNRISLMTNTGVYMAQSPVLSKNQGVVGGIDYGTGIYTISVWRGDGEGTTHIRFYDPLGNLFWSQEPTTLGTATLTRLLWGRTGQTAGNLFFSNVLLHDVALDLAA